MDKQEIKVGNRLLAEFEGLTVIENGFMKTSIFCLPKIRERELTYHEDWNELIRVFAITKTKSSNMVVYSLELEKILNDFEDSFFKSIASNNLESGFKTLTYLISWFKKDGDSFEKIKSSNG
jgi:hypothetical protein